MSTKNTNKQSTDINIGGGPKGLWQLLIVLVLVLGGVFGLDYAGLISVFPY